MPRPWASTAVSSVTGNASPRIPRFHTLEQLADFFHVTPGHFLDEHPDPQPAGKPDLRTLFRQIRKLTPDQQNRVSEFVTVLKQQNAH